MDKMKMETANKTLENLAKLKEMFPEVITETKDENGEIVAAVDAKKLEQLLSTKVIEGDECYDFTWVGKKQAMVEACKPIRKTLRPCREESVDWENTQNLYIEGDNLDVLKLLQESYLNKVKMIYIDPPYNTGNDSFIYPDDYTTNKDLYDEEVGAIDESGYRMFKNTKDKGRFHSSWCSMMYPRLKLARNLLSEDGVIFISIDDHEVENMKKMCDEVFGEGNFVSDFIRKTKSMTGDEGTGVNIQHENLLCYAKNKEKLFLIGDAKEFSSYSNPDNDINGEWTSADPSAKSGGESTYFPIENPYTKKEDYPPKGRYWAFSKSTLQEYIKSGRIVFKKTYKDKERGFIFKRYKDNLSSQFNAVNSLVVTENEYMNSVGTKELFALLDGNFFNNPKPTTLVQKVISMINNKFCIILDFFSGSATTAHAVMQLNAEDAGKRKFIMVQLPEVCDKDSDAYKAGYQNICEIGKERIRRAGKKIVEETGKKDLDIGFRVLKLDSSNMKDVYFTPEEYKQTDLVDMVSNIKDGRTAEDLLYACMLEWGLELSLPHKVQKIAGFDVHIVNNGDLVACFDDKVSEEAIKQIAEMKPLRAVFRDSSFATDAARVNVGEIFKLKSPNTTIKVL